VGNETEVDEGCEMREERRRRLVWDGKDTCMDGFHWRLIPWIVLLVSVSSVTTHLHFFEHALLQMNCDMMFS
jgi:hypothetical protein